MRFERGNTSRKLRRRGGRGPCDGVQPRLRGQRGCSYAGGSRASSNDDGCSADKSAWWSLNISSNWSWTVCAAIRHTYELTAYGFLAVPSTKERRTTLSPHLWKQVWINWGLVIHMRSYPQSCGQRSFLFGTRVRCCNYTNVIWGLNIHRSIPSCGKHDMLVKLSVDNDSQPISFLVSYLTSAFGGSRVDRCPYSGLV